MKSSSKFKLTVAVLSRGVVQDLTSADKRIVAFRIRGGLEECLTCNDAELLYATFHTNQHHSFNFTTGQISPSIETKTTVTLTVNKEVSLVRFQTFIDGLTGFGFSLGTVRIA